MKRLRGGFRLGRRLSRLWPRIFRLRSRRKGYTRLARWPSAISTSMTAVLRACGRRITRHFRPSVDGDQAHLLGEGEAEEYWRPPKGHLAVYVGVGQQAAKRYVVPVVHFNHPLFRELLREAEEEFGFCHPGCITIPCHSAEFERVWTRIASASRRPCWKSSCCRSSSAVDCSAMFSSPS
ncbi:hypothetical protein Cni_G18845 [Canna indica]|uniref:SAUR family protein n=1 Tax=Canna indica TaxID=4628 RepID=A0AAQ3KQF5_9LILI|nr:hypothetical protein Cni_G18845 [Canna indica]